MRTENISAKTGASWRSAFGFTLVELVVITILVILLTVAFLCKPTQLMQSY